MNILLVESDRLIRDQIKVGLQQFPEFTVTCGESYPGVNRLRMEKYDYVFLGLPGSNKESLRLLDHMRSFDQTQAIAIADQQVCKDLSREKSTWGIHAFLSTPINEIEFFRLAGRLKDRHTEDEPVRQGSSRR